MRRYLPWLGLAGVLISVLVAGFAAFAAYLHPFNHSAADNRWTFAYLVIISAGACLFWTKRYRAILQIVFWSTLFLLSFILVFSDNGPAILCMLWLILLSASMGRFILDRLSLSDGEPSLERILLDTGLGLGVLVVFTMLLGLAHFLTPLVPQSLGKYLQLLHPTPAYAALILLSLLFIPKTILRWYPWASQVLRTTRQIYQTGDLRIPSAWIGCMFICALGIFIWALSPGIWFDSLVYHLAAPSLYIQNRGIIQISEPLQFYWAHYGEMLFTLAMLLVGQPLTGLMSFSLGLVTCGLVFLFGRRIGGTRVGVISSLLFYSLPILFVSGIAYNDITVTLFTFAMFYCLLLWWQEQKPGWVLIAGIFAGLAMGTKFNAVIMILPGGVLLLFCLIKRHRLTLSTLIGLLQFAIPTILLFLPWAILNWQWIGNPVYPFLSHFFHSNVISEPPLTITDLGRLLFQYFVLLPWDLTVNGGKYFIENPGAATGVLMLLVLPWMYFSKKNDRSLRQIALVGAILSAAVLLLDIQYAVRVRYILPLFPLLAVLASLNIDTLAKYILESKHPALGINCAIILSLVYLFTTRMVFTTFGWQIPERYPYKVALGLETPTAYLSRTIRSYDAYQFINQQGDGRHQIAVIGDETRAYTTSPISSPFFSTTLPSILDQASSPSDLAQSLSNAGFDFLVLDRANIDKFPQNYDFPNINASFLQNYTRLVFARNDVYVYRLSSSSNSVDPESASNLIADAGFEEAGTNSQPVSWVETGNPTLDRSGKRAHTGQAAVSVTSSDILYTTVPVEVDKLFTLKEWFRADKPDQNARMQIMWLNQDSTQGSISIDVVPVTTEWKEYDMSVTVPDGIMAARVYITAHDGSRIWVDDVCLAEGPTCPATK